MIRSPLLHTYFIPDDPRQNSALEGLDFLLSCIICTYVCGGEGGGCMDFTRRVRKIIFKKKIKKK